MNAVAIVSVALSALIALTAIVAGVWQQGRAFRHERAMADRQSARSVLADTTTVLHRAEYTVDEVHIALSGHAVTMFDPDYPERAESVPRLEAVGRELDQALGLIKVQLGPKSSATEALEQTTAALLDAYRAVRTIRFHPATTRRPIARLEEANEEREAKFKKARDEFKAAVARFVERAHAIAGAQLLDSENRPSAEPESGIVG